MGSGLSRVVLPCLNSESQTLSPSKTHHHNEDIVFSQLQDEALAHSFRYPSNHSARFVSPTDSLRFSSDPAAEPAAIFKSISGASIGANSSVSKTILPSDLTYHNAAEPISAGGGFHSSASFSALPLQPAPRPDSAAGALFMSGPIERGALSGPLDAPSAASIHFSAPLGGLYGRARRKKKGRPWVFPVLSLAGRRDPAPAPAPEPAEAARIGEENAQWAHGKAGEDRVHVVISDDQGWLFVGIYDGFNGPDAPEFLMAHLYRNLLDELEGLFWERFDDDRPRAPEAEAADPAPPAAAVRSRWSSEDFSLDPTRPGPPKQMTFESEREVCSGRVRRKTLWEFLAEEDEEDRCVGLGTSNSKRFDFSPDNASIASKQRSILLSKLKSGFSRSKERNRRLFPWKFDWEEKEKEAVDSRVEERFQRGLRRSKVGAIDHSLVLSALSQALAATEVAYLDMTEQVLDRNPELALMGSCLLVVLMREDDVYVMNVGDSRAIVAQYQPQGTKPSSGGRVDGHDLRRNGEGIVEESSEAGCRPNSMPFEEPNQIMKLTALQLSTDHSTSIEEEVLRIKEEHPDDSQCIVNDRVKGRLKVTRAFGAGFLKQPKLNDALLEMFRNEYIGAEPYITCSPSLCHHKLALNDQFLVLSSDGLYQYLTNQEVVSHVESFMEKFPDGDPAKHLIEEILSRAAKKAGMGFHELLDIPQGDRRKYHDDVTVMVVSLEGRIWKSSRKYL